jgi:16S rRNA (adenine1518-N6/adenine1519-N6)-dimethyltransferase
MAKIKPKKHLGQHFLRDTEIARRIVASLRSEQSKLILEIGPGMGVLTNYLLDLPDKEIWVIDIDIESTDYLKKALPKLENRILTADFLKTKLPEEFSQGFLMIGNLPYNIS